MNKNKKRPLVFCIDNNYSQHLAVALESLYFNNKYCLEVHVFHSELYEINLMKLHEIMLKYNANITFHLIDKGIFEGYKENFHFTIAMYFRLLIPDLLSEEYKSAIYLDSDIVINGDISYLMELDISDNILAAVGNPSSSEAMKRLGADESKSYFDSGLIIFNLEYWRDNRFHHKVLKYIRNNSEKLLYPDNDALNVLVNGNFIEISPIYSLQSNYIKNEQLDFNYFLKFGDFNQILLNPLIIQFAGGLKPWHYLSQDYYKNLYFKYLRLSPYGDFRYMDKTWKNIVVKHIMWPLKRIIGKNDI